MKNLLPVILLFLGFSSCREAAPKPQLPDTLLLDNTYLAQVKTRLENNDSTLIPAYDTLLKEADNALKKGPYSVTDKKRLAPSGNKNDYASYSRYWWPDPDQADGLPYIRKDGETNPSSQNLDASDRPRIGALARTTQSLGLAYYFTGDEQYAAKVAELIETWFLNEDTKMNPNVNHAQCRPGHNTGSKSGILDGRLLVPALEAARLIKASNQLNNDQYVALKDWASDYFNWLTTNEMALEEAQSKNNHGSYYDAQALYFALYSENQAAATTIAEQFFEQRVSAQIEDDGSMPEEMARTRPLFYSIYNLHAMFLVAKMSEHVDVNNWGHDNQLRGALDHLAPYADSTKKWPTTTLGKTDRMALYPLLLMAQDVYPDGNYADFTQQLPAKERQQHLANLCLLFMR
ncbi:MAG: alginate lyase family protein [Saprospiraceae bacterium]|nr:alginate lyase family protein [Saprospiraceae bacterium]